MKFSEQWLREWVNPELTTEELAHQLTMAGLEVDAIEPVAGTFSGVKVGRIVAIEPHPDADKLRVCEVDVGEEECLTIVCGAPNARQDLIAPTAVVGAALPGDFKIKKAKLRGVPSFGMLCSAKELGLSEAAEGLMELPADAPVGSDFRHYLGLDDNTIEIGLTPNRADCLSIAGIARETGVLCRSAVNAPSLAPVASTIEQSFPVSVAAEEDCPRYVGRVIRGINAKAKTPMWMQERLRRSDIRSLGPVVDVTNYVLLELGQPMHGFDLDRLKGGISVRHAAKGESLELLNGNTIELADGDLVIADDNGPLALAGIMGGEKSGVTDETQNIFLESAFFTPERLAGRARRYGLHTDSSHRFERGVDPALQRAAIERATALLLEIVGGEAGPVTEVVGEAHLPTRNSVKLRYDRIKRVLGTEVAPAEVKEIIERLDMSVTELEDGLAVQAPTFRFDIAIEEDLIEEIARISGYDNLPTELPMAPMVMKARPEDQVSLNRFRQELVGRGYQEVVSYSFVDPKVQTILEPETTPIALANPISADLAVMRTTLWASLLPLVVHNTNRQQSRVRLFESGLRFLKDGEKTNQIRTLSGVVYGSLEPEQWAGATRPVDFFDVKGDVEAILSAASRCHQVRFVAESHSALHPGQSARIYLDDQPVGWMGLVHPAVEKQLDLAGKTYAFELDISPISSAKVPKFEEISKFPANRRDLALLVDKSISADEVADCIKKSGPTFLRELKLFDVYEGERIDSSRKSLAIGLTLQEQSRTLTDEEVDSAIAGILRSLQEKLGATLRE